MSWRLRDNGENRKISRYYSFVKTRELTNWDEKHFKYLIIFLLATSCVGQVINVKAKSSHNSQATELQRNEKEKPDPSGLKHMSFISGEILSTTLSMMPFHVPTPQEYCLSRQQVMTALITAQAHFTLQAITCQTLFQ